MPSFRAVPVALLLLSTGAAAQPRAARRAATGTSVRPHLPPRARGELSLARFRPTSISSGATVGVAGPLDPDNPLVEATIAASADSKWRFRISVRGVDGPPQRLSRAQRLELRATLRGELIRNPALAEPLAYLIADIGDEQPPIARFIDLGGFTIVRADAVPGEEDAAGFRFRGTAGDRLIEIEMTVAGSGQPASVRVRRWKPGGAAATTSRGRSRALGPGEIESLARVLRRRARDSHDVRDPSGQAAGILERQRDAHAADH